MRDAEADILKRRTEYDYSYSRGYSVGVQPQLSQDILDTFPSISLDLGTWFKRTIHARPHTH